MVPSARRSSDTQTRELAREIGQYRRATGKPASALAEIHDINLRSNRYVVRNPQGALIMETRVDGLLRNIQRRENISVYHRNWATRHLAIRDQIQKTSMSQWLDRNTVAIRQVAGNSPALKASAARLSRVRLMRIAGPLGAAVAIAVGMHEWQQLEQAYREGRITHRDRFVGRAGKAGGVAGAIAGIGIGAPIGFKIGASIGTLGGPWAPITVPVGGFIGGLFGGVIGVFSGYRGGESAATWAADAWYERLEQGIKDQVDNWILATTSPP